MANDNNKDQKEEETKTLQEKYDEVLEELDSKNKELAKINEDLEKQKLRSIFHYLKDFRLISKTSKKSMRKKVKISSNLPMNHLSKIS